MSATVKGLASDAFQGRSPGTEGETRTVRYLIERFQALGRQPGGDHGGKFGGKAMTYYGCWMYKYDDI